MKNSCLLPDCVIPAAGLSSRMGSWKMMLPFVAVENHPCQQKTILDVAIDNALSFCNQVSLVIGHRHTELQARYANKQRVELIFNPDYQLGMTGSIQAGVAKVSSEYFFIVHGDMPFINHNIYQALWNKRGEYCVFPGTKAQTGHPVLLPLKARSLILAGNSQTQMKKLLLPLSFQYLELADEAIHFDVDTPQAYQALQWHLKSR